MSPEQIRKNLQSAKMPKADIDWGVANVAAITEDFQRRLCQELPQLAKAAKKRSSAERDTERFFRFGYNVKGSVEDPATVKVETKLGYSERTVNKGSTVLDTNQLLFQLESGDPIDLSGRAADSDTEGEEEDEKVA